MTPKQSTGLYWVLVAAATLGLTAADSFAKEERKTSQAQEAAQDGSVHVSAFDLPLSGFLSAETRAVLKRQTEEYQEWCKVCPVSWTSLASAQDVIVLRQCEEKYFYPPIIARQRARYKVAIQPETIAGVATEIITPVGGVPDANRHRVLINLHGGGFVVGGRSEGQMESIPIAAVGQIKVISVDYRMAPEYRFPAASEDAAAVYKALLGQYKPEDIGIYGCSAGGLLTAEAVAWFQKQGLPAPGAIGMFCGAAYGFDNNDSGHMAAALAGSHATLPEKLSYFRDVNSEDPLAYPGLAPQMMARFPDSLLITSTRDQAMSSVVVTHAQLVRLGVKAELHVWEGLGHAFFFESDLPESREAYEVIAHFFDEHLGGKRAGIAAAEAQRR